MRSSAAIDKTFNEKLSCLRTDHIDIYLMHAQETLSAEADEVANAAELLMGSKGAFITGADFLIDGGATASYFYGPGTSRFLPHG